MLNIIDRSIQFVLDGSNMTSLTIIYHSITPRHSLYQFRNFLSLQWRFYICAVGETYDITYYIGLSDVAPAYNCDNSIGHAHSNLT